MSNFTKLFDYLFNLEQEALSNKVDFFFELHNANEELSTMSFIVQSNKAQFVLSKIKIILKKSEINYFEDKYQNLSTIYLNDIEI